jgi:acyl-coenzyme A synthetase/AMP-(fatty) acid ligase
VDTYGDLGARVDAWRAPLTAAGVRSGSSVAVVGDFSPASVSCLLALMRRHCIVVPLAREAAARRRECMAVAKVEHLIELDAHDRIQIEPAPYGGDHPLLAQLRGAGEAGVVLFSSGTTGTPKAILHPVETLLARVRRPRARYRAVAVLRFDHIGGLNTLCHSLANLGCTVVPEGPGVAEVCRAIARYTVTLLPASPTFLNLLLLAGAHRAHDLSSLELVTYGTEPMPARTLRLATLALPHARFRQTYGLSELGILRSRSPSNESLEFQLIEDGCETKIVDGTLHIRTRHAMLGYLNAPTPFDADGWFDTGDVATEENAHYRILGRRSEVISVGGQKVYPVEVESAISEVPGVIDVEVAGEDHLLLGQIVVATVRMDLPVAAVEMKRRILAGCRGRLQPFMIPTKVRVVTDPLTTNQSKKSRRLPLSG